MIQEQKISNGVKKFYITTTLPYINALPHVGFALEIVQADVIARYQRNLAKEVFFNTGTDEHGLKVYQEATKEKKTPVVYCDKYAAKFKLLKKKLNLSYNSFIRTTDKRHIKAVQEFWRKCKANGDIYKKNYKIKYCVGCELEKTDSELVNGRCPIHPNREIEIIEEENYFFRFSKYQKALLDFYDANPNFVLPVHRQKEIHNFVKSGLEDFSISRLRNKMPWGISVPNDNKHVIYVWFDALINYISCLSWPKNQKKFKSFWGTKKKPNAFQVAGKDNLRQQTAMWQAMLMSAGLPNSKQVFIHGFINFEGQKISKSSNVSLPNPIELVEKYGTDPVRYYLLREIPAYEDGDFSIQRFEERYNSDLANGLGNLVARVLTLATKSKIKSSQAVHEKQGRQKLKISDKFIQKKINEIQKNYEKLMEEFRFHEVLAEVWKLISFCDVYIDREKPWKQIEITKTQEIITNLLYCINEIANLIEPFLPETSEKIKKQLKSGKPKILFPRL